jgi:hypothetical protein
MVTFNLFGLAIVKKIELSVKEGSLGDIPQK